MNDESPQADLVVAALYQFVSLENYQDLREPLLSVCHDARIKGPCFWPEKALTAR